MNKLLLIIASCVLLASAEEVRAENAYVGVGGGINWIESYHNHLGSFDLNNGGTVDGRAGYRWDNGVRLEGEVGYRYNKISKIKVRDIAEEIHVHAHQDQWTVMANALYEIPANLMVIPYVGGGVGYANVHSHVGVTEGDIEVSASGNTSGFAYQGIAGFECPLNCQLSLDTKYRYQKANNINATQSVEVGLVYAF